MSFKMVNSSCKEGNSIYRLFMRTCDEISPGSFKSQLMIPLAYWRIKVGAMLCEHSMDRSLKCLTGVEDIDSVLYGSTYTLDHAGAL